MEKIITRSEKETLAYGKKLAQKCRGGEIFGLIGNLGAGKTILAKGLAKGLGIKSMVNSPTFVIMKIHNLRGQKNIKKFCHIDAYRLKSAKDLEAIGALDYLNRADTVTLIEWADRVKKILPRGSTIIEIKHLEHDKREIKIN